MPKKQKDPDPIKTVARNRRALAKFAILESLEAGMVLTGPEVKSLRGGKVNMQEGFVRLEKDEAFLWNVHINPYAQGSLHVEQVPTRTRKLLLKRSEISRLIGKTTTKGLTLVPLEMYFNKKGKAKVKIGLARGKKAPDRREDIKKRELNREMRREFGEKQRVK
ncbi:SsrA-binding protein [bacterium F11]|nr:SsrA-binding protein [bacterium F11]